MRRVFRRGIRDVVGGGGGRRIFGGEVLLFGVVVLVGASVAVEAAIARRHVLAGRRHCMCAIRETVVATETAASLDGLRQTLKRPHRRAKQLESTRRKRNVDKVKKINTSISGCPSVPSVVP